MARHKHYDAIVAWAEGKDIQFKGDAEEEWQLCGKFPRWYEDHEYRVKPKLVKKEGWIALYKTDFGGLPFCCGVYGTEEGCRAMCPTANSIVCIEWEQEE